LRGFGHIAALDQSCQRPLNLSGSAFRIMQTTMRSA
jgi:hypothetical protein